MTTLVRTLVLSSSLALILPSLLYAEIPEELLPSTYVNSAELHSMPLYCGCPQEKDCQKPQNSSQVTCQGVTVMIQTCEQLGVEEDDSIIIIDEETKQPKTFYRPICGLVDSLRVPGCKVVKKVDKNELNDQVVAVSELECIAEPLIEDRYCTRIEEVDQNGKPLPVHPDLGKEYKCSPYPKLNNHEDLNPKKIPGQCRLIGKDELYGIRVQKPEKGEPYPCSTIQEKGKEGSICVGHCPTFETIFSFESNSCIDKPRNNNIPGLRLGSCMFHRENA